MARLNSEKMSILLDGENCQVPARAKIKDVVATDVSSVEVYNPASGKVDLVTRDGFSRPVSPHMTTHLSNIQNG